MRVLIAVFIFFLSIATVQAQTLKDKHLSASEIRKGIKHAYFNHSFENYHDLILYKNYRFAYKCQSTNYTSSAYGRWRKRGDFLYLNSDIDSNNVPVKIYYFDTDTIKTFWLRDTSIKVYSTKMQVPVNLKQTFLSDSRIFINDDDAYCFPYFDTCFGNIKSIDRIKVEFGSGFRTRWINVEKRDVRRMLIIAQVNVSFDEYRCFKNHRFKIAATTIKSLNNFE